MPQQQGHTFTYWHSKCTYHSLGPNTNPSCPLSDSYRLSNSLQGLWAAALTVPLALACIAPPFTATFSFPLCFVFLRCVCNFPLWSALLSLQDNCILAQVLTCLWIVVITGFFKKLIHFISFPPSFLLGNMFLLEGKDILVLLKGWDRFASLAQS